MTLNPAGHLIAKNSINDLYHHNYAITMPTAATKATTMATVAAVATTNTPSTSVSANATASEDLTGNYKQNTVVNASTPTPTTVPASAISAFMLPTAVATVAATAAMTAVTALLAPLPPPSSSFSTLDGVPRGKCAYFLKNRLGCPLTRDNLRREVICGDFPIHSKIETLAVLFDEILQPLLQNPHNRKMWPEVVVKDLNTRIKDVRNTLTAVSNQSKN